MSSLLPLSHFFTSSPKLFGVHKLTALTEVSHFLTRSHTISLFRSTTALTWPRCESNAETAVPTSNHHMYLDGSCETSALFPSTSISHIYKKITQNKMDKHPFPTLENARNGEDPLTKWPYTLLRPVCNISCPYQPRQPAFMTPFRVIYVITISQQSNHAKRQPMKSPSCRAALHQHTHHIQKALTAHLATGMHIITGIFILYNATWGV